MQRYKCEYSTTDLCIVGDMIALFPRMRQVIRNRIDIRESRGTRLGPRREPSKGNKGEKGDGASSTHLERRQTLRENLRSAFTPSRGREPNSPADLTGLNRDARCDGGHSLVATSRLLTT